MAKGKNKPKRQIPKKRRVKKHGAWGQHDDATYYAEKARREK